MSSWFVRVVPSVGGPVLLSLVAALALAGCDAAPGLPDDGRPPLVSALDYSPAYVLLDRLDDDRLDGDHVVVDLTLSVHVDDPDGDVEEVGYVVRSPLPGRAPLASGTLAPGGEGTYEASTTLRLPRGEVGRYDVRVYARDATGRLGNEVIGSVNFLVEGHPPVVEDVEAAPEVVRPPTDFRLVATVSDPDGLSNVARVVGRAPSGFEFLLHDDGATGGDEVAHDGRYTVAFDVPSATPGVQTFTIRAVDRAGLESEPFAKQITVE